MQNSSHSNKKSIRQAIGLKRKALSITSRRQKSMSLMRHLIRDQRFLHAKKIAAYSPHQGEVDPYFILEQSWKKNKGCYLPILHPSLQNQLQFAEYHKADTLKRNRYGILEPNPRFRKIIPAWTLDLVLLPLFAFDKNGVRLGSGKGYYDRTFSPLNFPSMAKPPILLGLAYDFQEVEHLSVHPWDILLSGIVTEEGILWFPGKEKSK